MIFAYLIDNKESFFYLGESQVRKCGLYLRLRVHLCGVCDGKRRVQRRERENTLMKQSVTKREREIQGQTALRGGENISQSHLLHSLTQPQQETEQILTL